MSRITIDYVGFDDLHYHITFDGPVEEKEVMAELDYQACSSGHSFTHRDFQRVSERILERKLQLHSARGEHGQQSL